MAETARYSGAAIGFHWLMAALIFAGLGYGLYMTDLPLSPQRIRLYNWHKWLGVTVLLLAALRLLWGLLSEPPPPLPRSMPSWEVRAARVSHGALYVLFFAVPLVGWAYTSAVGFPVVYLGIVPLPDWVPRDKALAEWLQLAHRLLAYLLAGVVIVHIGAALKHALVDHDDILDRMLPAWLSGHRCPIKCR